MKALSSHWMAQWRVSHLTITRKASRPASVTTDFTSTATDRFRPQREQHLQNHCRGSGVEQL